MTSNNPNRQALQEYRRAIEQKLRENPQQVGELAFRADFENLFKAFERGSYKALHEPLGVAIGQPDFVIQQGGVPVGYVECKDIGADLIAAENSEQLERYRKGLHNLILTDYLTFRWYVEGEVRSEVRLANRQANGGIQVVQGGFQDVELLLQNFLSQDVPSVGMAQELAKRMAVKTRLLRDTVIGLLDSEAREGRVFPLLRKYREQLVSDLGWYQFADMYAQTATYGLFAAWQRHPIGTGQFTRQSAVFTQMTPFLQETLGEVAGPRTQEELSWVIDDIARLLDKTDRESVMKGFGRGSGRDDPIIHFYEDFLRAYDSDMREMRGVYYTPLPVVSYIVRSIDGLLRNHFGIADGLADKQKIGDDPYHRVTILDPAAGTGTFLRAVVGNIHETLIDKGLGGIWPQYVKEDLLPRLHGFEVLMAPYTISHLSLAIALNGIDIGEDDINVVLTNSLEPAHEISAEPPSEDSSVEAESSRADGVKRDRPVMVVLGNPPYSGHSANRGEWMRDLLRGNDGDAGTSSYFHVDGKPLRERNPKWLNNDYVKFIRFAQWRIEQTGEGVLGFITSNSYLDGPTFRGMRRSLLETFDDIYILDLHGNTNKKEKTADGGKDENVFDIREGVAIALFVKRSDAGEGLATVHHGDMRGDRASKYKKLAELDVGSTKWTTITPHTPQYFFIPRDDELEGEYESGFGVQNIFPVNSVGIVTGRDKLTIKWSRDEISHAAAALREGDTEAVRTKLRVGADSNEWKVRDAQRDVLDHSSAEDHVTEILYRPFDVRATYYTGRASGLMVRPRPNVMRHMLAGKNLGLGTVRNREIQSDWQHVFASKMLTTHHTVSLKEVNYVFPLYLYPTGEEKKRGIGVRPNLDTGFTETASEATGLAFTPDGPGDLESTFGPEDVFHYVYAILHSPGYRDRYADYLKSDFPRIPLTRSLDLFSRLIALGGRLTELHLMETEPETQPSFPEEGNLRVDRAQFVEPREGVIGRVMINRDQYFDGVSQATWEFTIGGYRPAEKWLKDRKGRMLSADDVRHYMKMCGALAETQELMAEIDKVIGDAGGWPLK